MSAPNYIGPFKRYLASPTTLKYGYYYCAELTIPFDNKKRFVRVWLPENYDFENKNKRFPTMYFSDGQNLVDEYLSAYGEWELDKTVHRIYEETGESMIAIGIDCPKSPKKRFEELNPPYPISKRYQKNNSKISYADAFIDYIVDTLKPLIDSLFFTFKDRDCTAIGGSSMGGIMAFYAYIYRPDVFGYSLSFSPAFFLYSKKKWLSIVDLFDVTPSKNGKLFFYVGGTDFEELFTKPTLNTYFYLVNRKFSKNQLRLIIDTKQIHHEKAWATYLYEGLKFYLCE